MKIKIIFSEQGIEEYKTTDHGWEYVKDIVKDWDNDKIVEIIFDTKNPKHSVMLFGSSRRYNKEDIKRIEVII